MYYAMRFGQPSVLLKDRLGTVPPRRLPVAAAPDADASLELGQPDD
jgi:soluble lytic murein transglycosylase